MTAALFVGCRDGDSNRRHIPGSKQLPCAECATPVWFSPATLARSEVLDPDSRFVCLECAKLEGLEIQPPTGAQVQELADAGHDPGAWALRDLWGKKATRRPS